MFWDVNFCINVRIGLKRDIINSFVMKRLGGFFFVGKNVFLIILE